MLLWLDNEAIGDRLSYLARGYSLKAMNAAVAYKPTRRVTQLDLELNAR